MQSAVESQKPLCFAHSLPGCPAAEWEPLETHLERVATLAATFAAAFDAASWGYILGRCHDLGKYSAAFQEYISQTGDADAGASEGAGGRVDHSTFGARYVAEKIGKHRGQLLAFCIAGHHSGLPDWASDEDTGQRGTLSFRLNHKLIPDVHCPEKELDSAGLVVPIHPDGDFGFQIAFFTRMIFSCLIDADRLATEEFCDPDQARLRAGTKPFLPELKSALDSFLWQKQSEAPITTVNRVRAEVLSQCRVAATKALGFFSLHVPTGGGKTLSSLAFALDHAIYHTLRRVVVAIPFTSIIEQSADVYRTALGAFADRGLIEHHTNLSPSSDTRANQLGSENWDAPLIVTTNVQLFESLFAAAATPCRKLHRLARSVIVLDEAQTIPVELISPALGALRELVLNYGCSVVLCTATQPALEKREDFEIGLDRVRHIIEQPEPMFDALRRVTIDNVGHLTTEDLIGRLAGEGSVLCIVNTRAEAANIFEMLQGAVTDPATCFHLSTWMCGQHRRETLSQIRSDLQSGKRCRVVSTQLVEAGVDLDFPVVYRAGTGFDSIAQAAGRCNREGLLPQAGRVYVFEGDELPPPGLLRDAAQAGKELMPRYPDPMSPDAIRAYFQFLYWSRKHAWDKCQVLPALAVEGRELFLPLQFRTAASRFKMIRHEQIPILVPYDQNSCTMRDQLLKSADVYISQRRIQPYLVSVHRPLLRALEEKTLVVEHASGVWLLMNLAAYSPRKGLSAGATGSDPTLLMI